MGTKWKKIQCLSYSVLPSMWRCFDNAATAAVSEQISSFLLFIPPFLWKIAQLEKAVSFWSQYNSKSLAAMKPEGQNQRSIWVWHGRNISDLKSGCKVMGVFNLSGESDPLSSLSLLPPTEPPTHHPLGSWFSVSPDVCRVLGYMIWAGVENGIQAQLHTKAPPALGSPRRASDLFCSIGIVRPPWFWG